MAAFAVGHAACDAPGRIRRGSQVAGLYWHFVDLVWIFLYPLLYLSGRHS